MKTDIFIDGRGPLYRIDPRTKIIATISLCIFVFLPVKIPVPVCIAVALLVISFHSVGYKNTAHIFLTVLPMLILMLLFSPLYERSGHPLFTAGTRVILTKEGLNQSVLLDIRFFTITFVCALLFATTKMEEFIAALHDFRIPYKSCLTISLVFTSVPSIINTFYQIRDSHKLRRQNTHGGKKTVRKSLKNLFPSLTSAIVLSLRNIPVLAMSLESRGFGLHCKRTVFHDLSKYKHPIRDTIAFAILFVILFMASKR